MTEAKMSFATLLLPAQFPISQWKNGRGSSAQIAISPPESVFQNESFLWRLSSAHIFESGPFSTFPGYDRFLTVTQGKGLNLCLEGEKREVLLSIGEAFKFAGD